MTAEITTLPNGLRIVTETRQSIETAAVGVWVDIGSRYEAAQLSGVTHCLEHMLFKGTRRRSAKDIAFEIEAVGGHMNAYTSREHTTYYARTLKDDVPLALDVLSDILTDSVLDADELVREQEVIIQEIGQAHDTPDDIIFDILQEVSFQDQALGRSILGSPASVRGLRRGDLSDFLTSHYHAGSFVIAAVGNLDHATFVAEVERRFDGLSAGNAPQLTPAHFTPGLHVEARSLEQVHLALAWEGASFKGQDHYVAQVASMVLGGGMSSRLFQEVREERGLAYSVYSFASSHAETGLFNIYAGTGPEEAEEMLKVTKGEVEKLVSDLGDIELNVAKAQLKAGLMMGMEATTSRMEQMGRHMLIHGKPKSAAELIGAIDDVSLEHVTNLFETLCTQTPAFVALGGGTVDQLNW